ncbi:MAG: Glyoxalase/bleomycin resistance protein/dioxygenase [Gemmatimonadetes bacterium]|nr:Glyoxalase/bleomycin resistance protein/dioxygenase [Gemmatimonadota bacterium]
MRLRAAALGAAMLLAAVPSRGPAQVTPGRVVWHDLVTRNLEVSKAFYGGLFGWTWRAPTSGKNVRYVVAEMAGMAMAGLAESRGGKVNASQWITYFAADDVGKAAKAAVDSGATLVVPPTKTGSWRDEAALLTDPQGAPFALMKPGREPADAHAAAPVNGWLWVELWTADVNAAAAFYEYLLGYEQRAVAVAGKDYLLLQQDSTPMAGVLEIPVKDVRPNWLPTIRVADVNATVSRVVTLGGRVILAPRADIRNGTVAIIADPTGAALTLQQWDGPLTSGGPR